MTRSGLQAEALALYRAALRAAKAKPQDVRPGFAAFARAQFEAKRDMSSKEFLRVEALLRQGRRQLELLSRPEVTGVAAPKPLTK